MGHIRSYLASRAVVTGAAVVLLGSGAALADPGSFGLETATEASGDNEDVPAESDASQEIEVENEDEIEDQTVPEDGDGDRDGDVLGDGDALEGEAEAFEEAIDEPGEDERSRTARDVHAALTSNSEGREEGLSPGDEGFGAAVSANAQRRGGNGAVVSDAARGNNNGRGHGRGAEDGERGGPPDDVPGLSDDRSSPPSNADDPERVGPPNHVPQHARANANRGGDEDTNASDNNGDEPVTSNE